MSGGCDGDRPYRCDGCGRYTVTYPTEGRDARWYHACCDCRAFVTELPTLARSIQRACRRAEVAGLVETLQRTFFVAMRPAVLGGSQRSGLLTAANEHAEAIDAIARLAGGGA